MRIETVKLVYFSPTGTSQRAVQAIAEGYASDVVEHVDITTPKGREKPLVTSENELLVVGVPVYMGRVPALINDWLNSIQGHNTPTVCVVVYGNRVYDDALLELKNIVTNRGCIPFAGAAYIGEHSFSNSETPTLGRPDEDDLNHAKAFGQKVREKIQKASSVSQLGEVDVPGEYPYGGITELWDVDFIEVGESCNQCGSCAKTCPTGAVDHEESSVIDIKKCITCCACLKKCPQNAKSMKDGLVKEAQGRVNTLFVEPKQPESFFRGE